MVSLKKEVEEETHQEVVLPASLRVEMVEVRVAAGDQVVMPHQDHQAEEVLQEELAEDRNHHKEEQGHRTGDFRQFDQGQGRPEGSSTPEEDKARFDRDSEASRQPSRESPRDDFRNEEQREEFRPEQREQFRDERPRDDFRNEPPRDERRGPSKEEMLNECVNRQSTQDFSHCKVEAKLEIKRQEKMCSRFDKEKVQCEERSKKMCDQLETVKSQCTEKMTEENLRAFILKEAKRRCAFAQIDTELEGAESEGEQQEYVALVALSDDATVKDIESLEISMGAKLDRYRAIKDSIVYGAHYKTKDEATKAGQLASKFQSDAVMSVDVVEDFREGSTTKGKALDQRMLLAAKRLEKAGGDFTSVAQSQDIVETAQELKKQGDKGFGYKVLKFVGAKKGQELSEAKTLEEKKQKFDEIVSTIEEQIADERDPVLSTILSEELSSLKEQETAFTTHIEDKKEGAGGIFG